MITIKLLKSSITTLTNKLSNKLPLLNTNLLNNSKINSEISINGWIRNKRTTKNVLFFEVCDGSEDLKGIQCVYEINKNKEDKEVEIKDLKNTKIGSFVKLEGIVKESSKEQKRELQITKISEISESFEAYPIQPHFQSVDYLRTIPHLRQRTKYFSCLTKVKHEIDMFTRNFFNENEFTYIHVPILTSTDCEEGGEVFQVVSKQSKENNATNLASPSNNSSSSFFGKDVHLTVSSQLHLEMANSSFSRVYTISPCFRADMGSSESRRHLAEFYMLETELVCDNLNNLLSLTKNYLSNLEDNLLGNPVVEYLRQESLKHSKSNSSKSGFSGEKMFDEIETITYTGALEACMKNNHKFKRQLKDGSVLGYEHEKWMCEEYVRKPVFIVEYPKNQKPFYMLDKNSDVVENFDLIVPGVGELVGGSLREYRYNKLVEKIAKMRNNLGTDNLGEYEWYCDLRKYGGAKHGGFGVGFERLVMLFCGVENIRDVVQVGRWKGSCFG